MCVSLSHPLTPVARANAGRAVAFKVYDMDRDGYISNGELFLVLKMMVGNNLKVCGTRDPERWCAVADRA